MTPTEKRLEIFGRAIPWLRGYAYTMRAATHGIPTETTIELERFIDLEFLPALAAIPSETDFALLKKHLRNRTEMVNYGNGSVNDIPDEDCIAAADAIESLQAQLASEQNKLLACQLAAIRIRDELVTAQHQLASLRERVVEECITAVRNCLPETPKDSEIEHFSLAIHAICSVVKSPPVRENSDGSHL